ncbi:MAG: hypothetical protein AB7O59_24320 [Pirellulales bacterium]
MSIQWSRLAKGVLVIAAMVLMSGRSWAIYYGLPPSKDEWGLKYDVSVTEVDSDTLTVVFTLADEGRLKPLYSIELVAFSQQLDRQGGRSYDVKSPFELKPTEGGKRSGQVQIPTRVADRAKIRILTHMVDGKRQPSGGAYIDIPIQKYMKKAPGEASPLAAPPSSKVTR